MDLGPTVAKTSQSERLQEAIASYMQAVDSGRTPDQQEWLTRYSDVAPELAAFFANQELLDQAAAPLKPSAPADTIRSFGDYDNLEKIGQGGMGVVYKARQVSLKRTVALKMILAGVFADRTQVARFRQEAEVLARLQHPNIVQVYEIGEHEGQPYFSMEYVDGGSLAQKLKGVPLPPRQSANLVETLARAVHEAHERGVVHRDLKPANVLLTSGKVVPKITDFGLAKLLDEEGSQTRSGAIMGTASYMAREQATGHIREIGPRTDVYALGAILYEMLTGRPPFRGATTLDTLEQVRSQEPVPPTQLQPKTPRDLETICLKCLQKELAKRYASAEALADDLKRFLESRPILARPVGAVERTWRWCRRNPKLAATGASLAVALVAVAVTSVLLAIHYVNAANRRAETAGAVSESLGKATLLRDKAKAVPVSDYGRWREALSEWREALAPAKQTEQLLATAETDEDTRRRVQELVAELEKEVAEAEKDRWMVEELAKIPMQTATRIIGPSLRSDRYAREHREYLAAFQEYGIDLAALPPAEAAARIRARAIRLELTGALGIWAAGRKRLADSDHPELKWEKLIEVAKTADPDGERNRLRDALVRHDLETLKQAAADPKSLELPVRTQEQLGEHLGFGFSPAEGAAFLRKVRQRRPADFWINWKLANLLVLAGSPTSTDPAWEEAVRFGTAVVAIQPDSEVAHLVLANALLGKGALDDALAACEEAIRLNPDSEFGHHLKGHAHLLKGDHDKAIDSLQKVIRLNKDNGWAHAVLANALHGKGKLDQAIESFDNAIRLMPLEATTYNGLGNSYLKKGEFDQAIAAFTEAIRIDPNYHEPHYNLGLTHALKRNFDKAIVSFRDAIRLQPKDALAHYGLGTVYQQTGAHDKAIAAFEEAIKLKPDYSVAYNNLGKSLISKGGVDEAAKAYREAIRHDPRNAEAHNNMAGVFLMRGAEVEAIPYLKEAIRLKPDFAEAHAGLGGALLRTGALDDAIASFRAAIRIRPEFAEAHCYLGLALRAKGEFEKALAAIRHGHELGRKSPGWSYPSSAWISEVERLVELDQRLPAVLQGKEKPVDNKERIEFAAICRIKGLPLASARLYEEAFGDKASSIAELKKRHRFNAAGAAALVGTGQGLDAAELDDSARARWRKQALDWLRAHLDDWEQAASTPQNRAVIQRSLGYWQRTPDFAGVRDEAALAKLPEAEREAWRKLWADVDALLKRTKE